MTNNHEKPMVVPDRSFLVRPRFSLLALLVFFVIAALETSQLSMMQQLREAQAEVVAARNEVEASRNQFGSLEIDDPGKIHVGRIKSRSDCYRLKVPSGHRLLLHLTETEFPSEAYPENPIPSQTLSMNSWRDGADVILQWQISRQDGKRRIRVSTNTEELFDYTLKDWKEGPLPNSITYATGETQVTFAPDENIYLMKWLNDSTRRGVMLWLEPAEKRYPSK